MHLPCGGMYNNHIVANFLQSVPVKEFENWSIIGKDMDISKVARFYGQRCICVILSCTTVEWSGLK